MEHDPSTVHTAQAFASFASADSRSDIDPHSDFWSGASRVFAEVDFHGQPVSGHRTEILLRWTTKNFYALFVCPYERLHLKPDPDTTSETYGLWNYDVAEAFIGEDFVNIRRYKEFEVSPQGEWVDLDVDLGNPPHEKGWIWKSGIEVSARIDAPSNTWYGFMRIPWSSISCRPPVAGMQFRANFYRCQGSDPDRKYLTWRPVHRPSFHTPECFGIMTLIAL